MKREKIPRFEARIIGGEFKGRKFEIPGISTTRSSKNILRESLFNTLQFDVVDTPFVEVFAGSGSVGLEALSRGASRCYFIERDPTAYRFLQANVERLDPSRCETIYGDSFARLPEIAARLCDRKERAFFYFDPPFAFREGMEDIYEKSVALIAALPTACTEGVIVEHMSQTVLPETIGSYRRYKQKRFGKSTLSYYKAKDGHGA